MPIKSILCIFNSSENELPAVDAALLLGKAHNAQIRFLHLSYDPYAYAVAYGYGDSYAFPALIEAYKKENKERLDKAKQYVISLAAKYQVPLDLENGLIHHACARFVPMTGQPEDLIGQQGRLSDLIVIGRTATGALYDNAVVAALFATGRPVMLLPAKEGKSLAEYKTIALAWKGTLDAGRAMYNAMPFLEKAEQVFVLTAEGHGETYDINAKADLMEYMKAHGVKAQCVVVAAGNCTPAEALLTRAREFKADLLVMGAYGHTRFREMMLGGVTNHMLEKADIPLLLSH